MAADEWRLCVDWLVKCKILPDDHRATLPEAQAFDLAQALRDGVLLCHLLNSLKPYSVDPKDFSPRPQLSQFLCLKNVRTFLQTCEKVFGVKSADLFDPQDLFSLKNFRKVLHTLSKLSKTPLAETKGYGGFPPHNSHANDAEEDIYGNLSDMAIKHDIEDNDDLYDSVYQEGEDEIYEDLCSTRRAGSANGLSGSSLPTPKTKRDYCIKEMVDTERNYVDALTMINNHFIKPLKNTVSKADRDIIFSNIEPLLEVHTGFYAELQHVVTNKPMEIHSVFIKWKEKFLIYGEYCSNLPRAQEHIEELFKKNDTVKEKIEECERNANEARFRLRDLLHVPMQRVLKYHLLLRELIKNTTKHSLEHDHLQTALEEMQDLSLYVNEVKRDNEALQLIQEIQNSIVDLQMPSNTSLKDYGRLQKDGELKVRSHIDNKVRPRYIFLFDKVMLMAKSKIVDKFLWGETYSFKEAIVLAEFKVDASTSVRDGQRKPDKWNCSFQMVKQDQSLAYTFFAKTEDMKTKWIEAINLALDNTQPAAGKNFVMTTFPEPKICDICKKLLRGIFFQGYMCSTTKMCVHKECIGKNKQTGPPFPPSRKPEHCKAIVSYPGNPVPPFRRKPLRFEKDAIIEVMEKDRDWWKGTTGGQEGWFPEHLVEPINKPRRQPSYLDWKIKGRNSQSPENSPPPCPPGPGYVNIPDDAEMVKYDWYVGPMQREVAAEKLKRLPDGAYLVRMSENTQRRGNPALSIRFAGTVRHIKIERNAENMFYMADTKYFKSLPDLVEYYQKNTLADSFPEVKTTLQYPYKTMDKNTAANGIHSPVGRASIARHNDTGATGHRVLSYATAVYDYAATSTSQISLKTGDRVAVISKTGSDKGWWKGEHCDTHRMGYFPYAYVREEDEE